MRLLFLLILSVLPLRAWNYSGTTNVAATEAAFTNAYLTVPDNWKVKVAAGTVTLNTAIAFTAARSVSVQGADNNATSFVMPNVDAPWDVRNWNPTNPVSITHLNIIGAAGNGSGGISVGKNPPATPSGGFVELGYLNMTNVIARGISVGYGDIRASVHHCYLESRPGGNFTLLTIGGNEYYSWTNSTIPFGTSNSVVIEDCYLKNSAGDNGNGFFDCYNGAQLEMRHNTFDGSANSGSHGYDSQVTSVRTADIHHNTWTNLNSTTVLLDWRGGVLLWHDNVMHTLGGVTANQVAPQLKLYRACDGLAGLDNFANVPQVATLASNPSDGDVYQIINQPKYTFKTTVTGGNNANRYVKIGATRADSVSNLVSCINLDPAGSGTRYAAITATSDFGPNWDVRVVSYDATSLTLTNIMDGTGFASWPAAQQHGVIKVIKGTNTGVQRYPCYAWDNTFNGVSSGIGFGLAFVGDSCNGHNNVINLLQDARDYFMDTTVNWVAPPVDYTPFTYPHPAVAALADSGGGGSSGGSGSPTISGPAIVRGVVIIDVAQ